MPFRDIIFGEYLPDLGGFPNQQNPGYLIAADSLRPTPGGYQPLRTDVTIPSAATLGATPISAAGFAVTTTPHHFAGSAAALFQSNDVGVTWNTNSRAAGYTSATQWDFALFDDLVIAVNGLDEPQSKSIAAAVGDDFADLAGSPPEAARVARIRDHVVLGRLLSNAYAVQTSAIGDPEDWPTVGSADALAKQSIFQELPRELGQITQVVGGEKYGLVFQSSGITRMTYVGGDVVYSFDTFERSRGTGFAKGAIRVGPLVYYMSSLGVFRTDGFAVQNLSFGKVEDSVIRDLISLTEGIDTAGQTVAYDARHDAVAWSFTSAGVAEFLLYYHIASERFTVLRLTGTLIPTTLYSVRNAASEFEAEAVMYAFNASNQLISFTRENGFGPTIQTGFIELVPGRRVSITGIVPLRIGHTSNNLSYKSSSDLGNITAVQTGFTAAADVSARSGIHRARSNGRYHAFRWTSSVDTDSVYRGLRVFYEVGSAL